MLSLSLSLSLSPEYRLLDAQSRARRAEGHTKQTPPHRPANNTRALNVAAAVVALAQQLDRNSGFCATGAGRRVGARATRH